METLVTDALTILCTGDREWSDESIVRMVLARLPAGTILVHGDARGLDTIAGRIGKTLDFIVRPYPADWNRFSKAWHRNPAGPIRNKQMLDSEHPNVVYAWHDDLVHSRGTKDMVKQALKAGVPVIHFSHANPDGIPIRSGLL